MWKNESEKRNTKEYWDERTRKAQSDSERVYISVHYARQKEICERLIEMFVKPGMTFLDVGCGFGRFYPNVAARGADYLGIDFSEEMIKEAKKLYPAGKFQVTDWNVPNDLGQYDVVFESICLSSFAPVENDHETNNFATLLSKYVKEGGLLIMVEPNTIIVKSSNNIFSI